MSLKHLPTLIAIASLAVLAACQDKAEPVAATPMPIIQNNQLRYPAGHPQLPLLVSTPAAAAQSISVELPARLGRTEPAMRSTAWRPWSGSCSAASTRWQRAQRSSKSI